MFQNYHLMYSKPTDESRLFLVAKPFEIWVPFTYAIYWLYCRLIEQVLDLMSDLDLGRSRQCGVRRISDPDWNDLREIGPRSVVFLFPHPQLPLPLLGSWLRVRLEGQLNGSTGLDTIATPLHFVCPLPALPPPSKTTQPPQGWQDYMQPDFFLLDSVIFKHRFLFKLLSCGTWGLMMTVLINAYTTDLISFLTAPRLKPMPNNFEELSKRSDLQLNLEKDFAVTSIILVLAFNSHQFRLMPIEIFI